MSFLLETFSCLYYPNLYSYSTHKLTARFKCCIFLGYSSWHLGYCCLSLQSGKLFISHNVVCNETYFPFIENSPLISSLPLFANNGSLLGSIPFYYPPLIPPTLVSSSTLPPFTSSPTSVFTSGDSPPIALGDLLASLSSTPCHLPKCKTLYHSHQVTLAQPHVNRGSPSLKSSTSFLLTHLCSKYPLPQWLIVVKLNYAELTSLSFTLHNPHWHQVMRVEYHTLFWNRT